MGKTKTCKEFVEDWCLEHECWPEDLDIDVVELQTITTRCARRYLPQYIARYTSKFTPWYWRKIICLMKDAKAPPEKWVWAQVSKAKSRFNPSYLLSVSALEEYKEYLQEEAENLLNEVTSAIKHNLLLCKQIPMHELLTGKTVHYTVCMY
jgi:hypothetical protein